jgi:hypothetical protein
LRAASAQRLETYFNGAPHLVQENDSVFRALRRRCADAARDKIKRSMKTRYFVSLATEQPARVRAPRSPASANYRVRVRRALAANEMRQALAQVEQLSTLSQSIRNAHRRQKEDPTS